MIKTLVTFFSNYIGLNCINLNNLNLDEYNFDDYDLESINHISLGVWYNRYKATPSLLIMKNEDFGKVWHRKLLMKNSGVTLCEQ